MFTTDTDTEQCTNKQKNINICENGFELTYNINVAQSLH